MDPNELIPKITATLDALLRSDPSGAYDLLTVMLGDAQFYRDFERWGSGSLGMVDCPARSDYPKPEPRTEKN